MKQYDITLLTQKKYVNPETIDWYTQQILTEDGLVQAALEKKGLRVFRTNWDNPTFDWTCTSSILFRTTWDYSHRFEEFFAWLTKVSTQTQLINSASQILWNLDKYFLQTLRDKGVNTPATEFIAPKTKTTLAALQAKLGWEEMVLKPRISAGGRHTYRLHKNNLADYETVFQETIAKEAMMLQPFLYNIVTKGEVALMVVGGKVTHAVLKKAKEGDFRVQDDFGGSVHDYTPSAEEIAFGEKAVAACPEMPIYARVDIVWDNDDKIALSEIELIEPEMWFRCYPKAADVMAEAIVLKLELVLSQKL